MSKYIVEVNYKGNISYLTFNATQVVLTPYIREAKGWNHFDSAELIKREAKGILDKNFIDSDCKLTVRRRYN